MKSSLPKILHEIAGKPLIRYIIDTCLQIKHSNIITVTNDKLKDNNELRDSKVCVQKKPDGTAGAVKSAIPFLTSDYVIILCADTPLVEKHHLEALIEDKNEISFIAMNLPPKYSTMPYGRVLKSKDGEFHKIVEYKNATEDEKQCLLANSGIYKIKTCLINKYIDFIEPDILSKEIYFTNIINILKYQNHSISIIETNEYLPFHGINTMEDLSIAEKIMQNKLKKKFMLSGVKFMDDTSVYLSYDTIIDEDVTIEQNVIIKKNVAIKKGSTVKAFSYLEDCELCENSTVGPFARIRGNTKISEKAEIGNFVEIKASNIGAQTKIKHLAYIGDAMLGTQTNIGAGTITCNYDGIKKHKTQIGDNVMVGANCSLIAPIQIDSGSIIAASSVIDSNIPQNSLAITRPILTIKPNKAIEILKSKLQN
jgi:bifunctional UDP-N-acetylglucosamine pyrophosphorylase/glucosamine-1-phosphate N-acetyltransferase